VTTHEALEALEEAKRRALEVHGYSAIDKINEAIVILQAEEPRGDGLKEQRRHSGSGMLVYANNKDDIGESWCTDCRKWLSPDEWRKPCPSQRERRKAERRTLTSPARTEGLREEVAWLIEDMFGGQHQWWKDHLSEWVTDANQAHHFASKEEAEKAIADHHITHTRYHHRCYVTEHVFMNRLAAHPSATGGDMTKTENAVIQAAYHWSFNPTDREAKRALYDAVKKDMDNSSKLEDRRYKRAHVEPQQGETP
jgi:hypothetical protein